MGISLIVNATFILSGMIGFQLEYPDGHGSTKVLKKSAPFSISIQTGKNERGNIMSQNLKDFNCGKIDCNPLEKCVTWQRQDLNSTIKECMKHDGRYSTKVNPHSSKLCGQGETHSLILSQAQKCLEDNPPCDIIWKYKCVKEEDSPHNCSLKRCPTGFICLEIIHCNFFPPCVTEAKCHHHSEVLAH